MTRYRMYCGLKTRKGADIPAERFQTFLDSTVRMNFPGFTTYTACGYWQGKPEPTMIIETLEEPTVRLKFDQLAKQYATEFDQEAVLVTQETVSTEYIGSQSVLTEVAA